MKYLRISGPHNKHQAPNFITFSYHHIAKGYSGKASRKTEFISKPNSEMIALKNLILTQFIDLTNSSGNNMLSFLHNKNLQGK